MTTEAVEMCPHCMHENTYPDYDVEKDGYLVRCRNCQRLIFLCDECQHAEDNLERACDWTESENGASGTCFWIRNDESRSDMDEKTVYCTVIEGVPVESHGITDEAELTAYCSRGQKKYGDRLKKLMVQLEDNGEVTLTYDVGYQPFQRIRRITGYLVGGLNRWNNAKRAEERDRVKHGEEGTEGE